MDQYRKLVLLYDSVGLDTSSPFIVIADSLLIDVLSNPLLDWKHGGQFLHFISALERIIVKLKKRG
jgi:hypothetical protein